MKSKAKETGEQFVNKVKESVSLLAEKFKGWLDSVMEKVKAWAADVKTKAKEAGGEFVKNVVDTVKELPGKMKERLTEAVQKVKDWASELGGKAKEAGQEIVKKVTEELKGLPEKLKQAGKDLVDGLWAGINDKAAWIKEKISGFVGNVTDWIKEFFGINSPSKVMQEEVGVWIPEGMAVGIKKNAKSAISAMKNTAKEITKAATPGESVVSNVMPRNITHNNSLVQNIYTPKAASRLEIYRQTKNLLNFMGG